ncbi:MAG: 2-C-methyl-D-erythritol 4-phosphate cytidylyltransferase [Dysgonamonadaceae bacterium]|jgi:2-C-methyl-D-erythritol 4-phosphate cytidylyltransferase|nr:2-C-methyl-D-erythritol 4-phosphate cytidylyltransferase [Dysgonamonadaceae bacterium]
MKKYVIIVAGGNGSRMGSDIPKQFLLLKGKPVLMYAIEAFHGYDSEIKIILVLPKGQLDYWKELCKIHQMKIPCRIVTGGVTRYHSVKNALELIEKNGVVAIHDGARPLISRELIARTFQALGKGKAVCPVIPVVDSLRIQTNTGTRRVNRELYFQVQTPQIFLSKILLSAYLKPYMPEFTDDISVVEASRRCRTITVEGSPENIKITTPVDLLIAEALLSTK